MSDNFEYDVRILRITDKMNQQEQNNFKIENLDGKFEICIMNTDVDDRSPFLKISMQKGISYLN